MAILFPSGIPVARAALKAKATWLGCDRYSSDFPDGVLTGPFIKLTRVTSSKVSLVQETIQLLVECYAPTEVEAEALARKAHSILTDLSAVFIGSVWVYSCTETSGIADYYDTTRQLPRYQFQVGLKVRGEEVS